MFAAEVANCIMFIGVCVCVCAVFIICFLPHHIFMLWFHFYPNAMEEYDTQWHVLRIIGFCLR